MSSPRLRVQFETLFEHFQGQDVETQLEDVTDILFALDVMRVLFSIKWKKRVD